jgi:hypothetical protein
MDRPRSSVPLVSLVPHQTAEDFIHRIADLKAEAGTRGYGTLAYFLDVALREATIQADQEAHDRKAKSTRSSDLWLPKG